MPLQKHVNPLSLLSGGQALSLLELAQKCLYCTAYPEYLAIFEQLKTVLPFDAATSGLAKLDSDSNIVHYELANISYPDEWMKTYQEKEFNKVDVIVGEHFTRFSPQFWANTYKRTPPAKEFIHLAGDFGLIDGYTYGAKPFGVCKKASLFSFSGRFSKYDKNIIAVLQTIIPHLHLAAYNTITALKTFRNKDLLSNREKEVLNWLKDGKSSWDISAILGISERTVNFHVYNIMKKLEVVNRAQAVAVATHLGMLEID